MREKGNRRDVEEGFYPLAVPCSIQLWLWEVPSRALVLWPGHTNYPALGGTKGPLKHGSSGVVITRVTVSLDFLCFVCASWHIHFACRQLGWALTLKTSQWKLKGSMGGTQNSIMYAKSPENVFSWWRSGVYSKRVQCLVTMHFTKQSGCA